MINNFKKLFAWIFLMSQCCVHVYTLGIILDPGHGGDSFGATYEYDGNLVKEKDINLKIAKFMEEKLKNYTTEDGESVKIWLTREKDECPDLLQRVKMGIYKKANIVISLHNNASGDNSKKAKGAMILVTSSNHKNFYELEQSISLIILDELHKLGITIAQDISSGAVLYNKSTLERRAKLEIKNGLLRRLSENGTTYNNGDVTDWYSIIRNGIKNNIPSILIEHAYLDNEEDYRNFLSTDEKLQKIAAANVSGIAKYYNLKIKS